MNTKLKILLKILLCATAMILGFIQLMLAMQDFMAPIGTHTFTETVVIPFIIMFAGMFILGLCYPGISLKSSVTLSAFGSVSLYVFLFAVQIGLAINSSSGISAEALGITLFICLLTMGEWGQTRYRSCKYLMIKIYSFDVFLKQPLIAVFSGKK